MEKIGLQAKTKAEPGVAEKYWFENEHIGLRRTLFHRVHIPLSEFSSGLDYEPQPVKIEIVMEWLDLNLPDPDNLDGLNLKSSPEDQTEVSLYLGMAHNPCDIIKMNWKRTAEHIYNIHCELFIDFEFEGVAENEIFKFETVVRLDPEIKE
ncbi:hypothetical protein D770_08855 [Flammeovirgaceae bacterium 311]|nr:hypothetical protein D770_08855 [Flammeovirgaceae bacterium 311]